MMRFSFCVLTMILICFNGLPASNQVAAPAGTMDQPSLDARRITSQTSSIDPGATVSAEGETVGCGEIKSRSRADMDRFASPTMVKSCLAAVSASNGRWLKFALLPPLRAGRRCTPLSDKIEPVEPGGRDSRGRSKSPAFCDPAAIKSKELAGCRLRNACRSDIGVPTARASPQPRNIGMILPGLQRPVGSKAARTRNMVSISASEKISDNSSRLSKPTPCSPVMLPPARTQISISSRPASFTR